MVNLFPTILFEFSVLLDNTQLTANSLSSNDVIQYIGSKDTQLMGSKSRQFLSTLISKYKTILVNNKYETKITQKGRIKPQ